MLFKFLLCCQIVEWISGYAFQRYIFQPHHFLLHRFSLRETNECEGDRIPLNSGLGKEKILYLDDDIVIVHKPPHALSVPAVVTVDSVATRIAQLLQISKVDEMIVHRLDYATSGIMVFARNYPALLSLNAQFRSKNLVSKSYVAVVNGTVEQSEGEIRLFLQKDISRGSPYWTVSSEGKESLTLWKNIFSRNGKTVLRLTPITGRTHQLRLHCAGIGHPILGDYFYSPREIFWKADRLLLHAEYLSFQHPRNRTQVGFSSPILQDWFKYLT